MDQERIKKAVEGLYNISKLLAEENVKHWLDWGTLLHAYRDGKLDYNTLTGESLGDNDMDIGLLRQDYSKVLEIFQKNNVSHDPVPIIHDYFTPIREQDGNLIRVVNKDANFPEGVSSDYKEGSENRKRTQCLGGEWLGNFWWIDFYLWQDSPSLSMLSDTLTHRKYLKLQQEIEDTPHSSLFCWGVDVFNPNPYMRQTKKYFVQELDSIDLYGYEFPIPRYTERFLDFRFGPSWRTPMSKTQHLEHAGKGEEARETLKEDKNTVLVEGVWDLFHQGHIELLKRAHDTYDRVVVGVASDDLVRSYKRDPIISYDDRVKMLEACKYVDEIYHNVPALNITEKALNECGADYALHSVFDPSNWKTELREEAGYSQSLIDNGRAHFLSYTNYHSTDIINKILKDA